MSNPNVNAIPTARSRMNVRTLVSLAMLTGIAYVVMLLSKILPQVYNFLQLDVKDTVICIGGFVFGPLAAAMISIVVALVEMFTVSDTGPIGFLMNVLATCAFSCTAAFVYKKMHTKKGAVIGLTLGTICLTAVMILWNYLITPIYQGIPRDAIVAMLPTVFLPFNVVKGGLNMALILVLYKPVVTALRKARLVPESQTILQNKGKVNAGFLLFSIALLATFVTIALVMMGILYITFPCITDRGDVLRLPGFVFLTAPVPPCCPCGIPCRYSLPSPSSFQQRTDVLR